MEKQVKKAAVYSMMLIVAAVIAGLLVFAPHARVSSDGKIDKARLEAFVRKLLLWGEQVQVEISDPIPAAELPGFYEVTVTGKVQDAQQSIELLVSRDGQKIIRGRVYDLSQNPFQKELNLLKLEDTPFFGPADAPIKMVVFSDFQCPYCKQEAEILRQKIPEEFPKEVAVYYKDFPLERIHPWAREAAIAGRCVYKQDPNAFWKYHDWVFASQEKLSKETFREQLFRFASEANLDVLRLRSCLEDPAVAKEVDEAKEEGQKLGVQGTPTIFVNGRMLPAGINWDQLKYVISQELHFQAEVPSSCCSVELAVPSTNEQHLIVNSKSPKEESNRR